MNRQPLLLTTVAGAVFITAMASSEGLPSLTTLAVPLIVIGVLILMNGFFVAAEFALIGVRPSQLEQMAEEGSLEAAEMHGVLDSSEKQDQYIATSQLGITIASLGLGMYGEPQIAHFIEPYLTQILGVQPAAGVIHTVASIVALGLLTYLHVVLGEMVPKSISLASPDKAALRVTRPMRAAEWLFRLPVYLLNGIGRKLLLLFKVPPAEGHARLHSAEELTLIVTESAEVGLLLEEEEEMIRNIFEFSDRQVGQVMTPRIKIQAIAHDTPPEELLQLVVESRHSRFPVYEQDLDHVIGILHLKDLVRQQLRNKGNIDLRLILRPAPAVPEDYLVERLLAAFKRQRIHMAIVLDEFGGLAGIVTLEDLVEEIVGEVRDEFDQEKEPLVELAPGVLEVAGNFLVDDLVDYVYIGEEGELPDVETIGGLIHTWLGRPPQIGDVVKSPLNGDVRFTVVDVDGLAVARAKIEFPVTKEAPKSETRLP